MTFDIPYIFALTVLVLGLFVVRRGIWRPEGLLILAAYSLYVLLKLLTF